MPTQHTPLALIILDGWGYTENSVDNAIAAAYTPVWNQLWKNYPHTSVIASGRAVGLPAGQMGNSEVGHLHMGAGRLVPQDLTRIDIAIENGDFYKNPVLVSTVDTVKAKQTALHIFGLLSPGGVHSHELHIQAMLQLAAKRGVREIYIHAFLDGRDTPPRSAKASLLGLAAECEKLGAGRIASIIGRYFAMDRDQRWQRIEQAYEMLTQGRCKYRAESALAALEAAYARDESDEFVQASCICPHGSAPVTIKDGDAIVFMNFRADRARQLTRAFTAANFAGFKRAVWPQLCAFVSLTEYAADIAAQVAYPAMQLTNNFGEYISRLGYRQLRIAETEKYAHVTFFFDGGQEKSHIGEKRILVPSPKVATYDLQPEMSAYELTNQLVQAIEGREYDVIICNFANADMIGHTGNFAAAVKAIEVIDNCLGRIAESLYAVGGEAVITADHGNAEMMFDYGTGQAHTAHTTNRVPVIYLGRDAQPTTDKGVLYDIAPTLLYLLGLDKPAEMTGKTLFEL